MEGVTHQVQRYHCHDGQQCYQGEKDKPFHSMIAHIGLVGF